jgi:hypothetical protein
MTEDTVDLFRNRESGTVSGFLGEWRMLTIIAHAGQLARETSYRRSAEPAMSLRRKLN